VHRPHHQPAQWISLFDLWIREWISLFDQWIRDIETCEPVFEASAATWLMRDRTACEAAARAASEPGLAGTEEAADPSLLVAPAPQTMAVRAYRGARASRALLGYGNPVMDATVSATKAEIEQLGLTVGVDAPPLDDEGRSKVIAHCLAHPEVVLTPGGATLNSVRVAQALLRTPGATAFLGAVGDDERGEQMRSALAAAGVDAALERVSDGEATGHCAVLVYESQRSLAGVPGAARLLSPDFCAATEQVELLESASIVAIDGFALASPTRSETTTAVAARATAAGGRIAVNLQSANLLRFNKAARETLRALLPLASFVFGNTDELEAFAELSGWAGADAGGSPEGWAASLAAELATGGVAAITAGSEPALLACSPDAGGVTLHPVAALPASEMGDTNGCGDAFEGGFLAAAAIEHESLSPQECALSCTTLATPRAVRCAAARLVPLLTTMPPAANHKPTRRHAHRARLRHGNREEHGGAWLARGPGGLGGGEGAAVTRMAKLSIDRWRVLPVCIVVGELRFW
jgi:adenosine kinase